MVLLPLLGFEVGFTFAEVLEDFSSLFILLSSFLVSSLLFSFSSSTFSSFFGSITTVEFSILVSSFSFLLFSFYSTSRNQSRCVTPNVQSAASDLSTTITAAAGVVVFNRDDAVSCDEIGKV